MRRFLTAAVIACLIGGGLAVVPVGAAEATRDSRAAAAAATPEPYTSPAVTRHVDSGGPTNCPSGYLCAYGVLSNSVPNRYYYFNFYSCRTYSLRYWLSYGTDDAGVLDHQTGNVTTTLYGASGNVLQTIKPKPFFQTVLLNHGGWDSVYSIKVC